MARKKVKCPKCKGTNIRIQPMVVGYTSHYEDPGLLGRAHNRRRSIAAEATYGLSNIFVKPARGRQVTEEIIKKVCVCQECGYSWTLKD